VNEIVDQMPPCPYYSAVQRTHPGRIASILRMAALTAIACLVFLSCTALAVLTVCKSQRQVYWSVLAWYYSIHTNTHTL